MKAITKFIVGAVVCIALISFIYYPLGKNSCEETADVDHVDYHFSILTGCMLEVNHHVILLNNYHRG